MSSLLVNSSVDVSLPEWLKKCLRETSVKNNAVEDERTHNDINLICRAFRFAYELHQGQFGILKDTHQILKF